MVNFRYHIVSIVAVFLALAVGIVMGTTVISESVIGRLERDARDFRARSGQLRQDADRLERELSYYDRFGALVVPPAIRGRLTGRPIVLISQEGTTGALIDRVTDALATAGALKPSRIQLAGDWGLTDTATRDRLSSALKATTTDPATLLSDAAAAIGRRLGRPADPRADGDLFGTIERAGLLHLEDIPARAAFPAAGSLMIVLPAGDPESLPDADRFYLPLLRAVPATMTVAVAETLDSPVSLAEKVRGDDALTGRVSTVDHASTWPGELSLVLALRDVVGGGAAAHYGVRRGTRGVAPEPAP